MRLAWFTPTSKKTSISGFSASILKYVQRDDCIVDVYTFDDEIIDEFTDVKALILPFSVVKDHFNKEIYDHLIYNFGNNWENHGELFKFAADNPGIVIVHDASLHHVVAYISNEIKKSKPLYTSLMTKYYGFEGARVVKGSGIETSNPRFGPWDSPLGPDFGFLDFFLRNQFGLVVHSKYTVDKLSKTKIPVPILNIRLPGDEKGGSNLPETASWSKLLKSKDSITLCSLGYINAAKNNDKLIDCISILRGRGIDVKLLILGGGRDKKLIGELRKRVLSLNLESYIEFALDLDRPLFNRRKLDADVFVSLRFPNYEGCSAAAFEAMQTGRPLVCHSTGPFKEIPSKACLHVHSIDVHEVSLAIEKLIANKSRMIALGMAGLRYSSSFNSADYADSFVSFVKNKITNTSSKALSGMRLLEIDAGFYSPKNIFLDRDAEKSTSLLSLWPFSKIIQREDQLVFYQFLLKRNPSLYWDVINHIKSVINGRYKNVTPQIYDLPNENIDLFARSLSILNNKIYLNYFLSIMIMKNIGTNFFDNLTDQDAYLKCIETIMSAFPDRVDYFDKRLKELN